MRRNQLHTYRRQIATICHLMCAFIFFCGISSASVAVDDAASKSDRAAHFASKGMETTLASCRLPMLCNSQPPLKSEKSIRETGNDNVVDERHLVFAGLEIDLLYVLGNNSMPLEKRRFLNPYAKPVILSVTVTGREWPVRGGFNVGTSRSVVEDALGKGLRSQGNECASYSDELTQDEVVFCYANDKLRSIKWNRWWDG